MGGSFALAAKRSGLFQRVTGYTKSPANAEDALRLGVIDEIAASALHAVAGSDVILIAVPVSETEATLRTIATMIKPQSQLVMDLGSTKTDVVAAARAALGAQLPCFVPAHPITGSELSGVAAARADLYQGKRCVITPLPETRGSRLEAAERIWQSVGSFVTRMSPEAHDQAYAALSHLPHAVAFAYIQSLLQEGGTDALSLGGSGFRDFSRIAASDPTLWRDVFLANRVELVKQMDHLDAQMAYLRQLLETADGARLHHYLTQASQARRPWGKV